MHIGTVFTLILLSIVLIAYIAQPFLKEETHPTGRASRKTARDTLQAGASLCSSCGHPLRSQDHFCPQCGQEIRKSS